MSLNPDLVRLYAPFAMPTRTYPLIAIFKVKNSCLHRVGAKVEL